MRVVVTCEHASCAVPPALRGLGLPAAVLRQHVGWDPGALPVARAIARACGAPLRAGRWSRLVADLNRSEDHPRVIAARVLGRDVPGNTGLDAASRAARLRRYWRPFRRDCAGLVAAAVARGTCLHLSVHSFVEELHGVERPYDIGLLFHPQRSRERAVVTALQGALRAEGFTVRKNAPYFGHTDGHTQRLRAAHPAGRYLGIEIELNQRLARTVAGQRRFAAAFARAVPAVRNA